MISLLFFSLYGQFAAAQTEENPAEFEIFATPREIIVEKINEDQKPLEIPELRGASETEIEQDIEQTIEDMIEIGSITIDEPEIEAVEPEKEPETKNELAAEDATSVLVPFYANTSSYLDQRNTPDHSRLTLKYEISTSDLDGEDQSDPQQVTLVIGPDYVSATRGKLQKLYDFKLNRLLEIKPAAPLSKSDDQGLIFDNVSLFAMAYRNMKTVLATTNNGEKRSIQIAEDQEIDAFWLESSMSWAAQTLDTPPVFKADEANLRAKYGDQTVFAASFGENTYESDGFKNALFAYAHHDWPLHPSILLALYAYDAPPDKMEIVSYGPRYPQGQKQIWKLAAFDVEENAGFPLPKTALSAPERQPVSPLVFIINEAAGNRALGGMQTPEQIEADFETALKAQDKMAQWLAGQKYISYTGECQDKDESWLCAALHDLNEDNKFASISEFDPKSKKLSDFISGVEMAQIKNTRATSLNTLQPYLDDQDAPSIILRTAAMARAGMKKSAASNFGVEKIQADALLKRALAADPYDPQTYLGLAQVYAAKGAYEQSWDMYDALRVAIPTASAVDLKIGTIEDRLRDNAAGYFLVD